ncbi:MAG: hypothetical protein FWG98_13575 [Candidatus Cloacimonetes bacterium]|nr:hypothetical protein [Candidatus Cloacimonadota bacterium]
MNKNENLAIQPIKFKTITYHGLNYLHAIANIDYNLSKILTQNILYSTYHKSRTLTEISELIGAPREIVEEEIDYLLNNGFMYKQTSTDYSEICESEANYLTDMLLHDFPIEIYEERNKIFTKYANHVCDLYIPSILDLINNPALEITCSSKIKLPIIALPNKETALIPSNYTPKIYTPENDKNYLLWSIITFALQISDAKFERQKKLKHYHNSKNKYCKYFATTYVQKNYKLNYKEELDECFIEWVYFCFPREKFPLELMMFNSIFDDRIKGWDYFTYLEYKYLYDFLLDRIDLLQKDKEKIISELRKFGYLVTKNNTEYLNLVVMELSKRELYSMIKIPEKLLALGKDLDIELYDLCSSYYPNHLQEACSLFYKNSINYNEIISRVLDSLLSDGILKPLTDYQKKTVNMILFTKL